jgi:O-antigen ligase
MILGLGLAAVVVWQRASFVILTAGTPLAQVSSDLFPASYYGGVRDALLVVIAAATIMTLATRRQLLVPRSPLTIAVIAFCVIVLVYVPLGPSLTQGLLGGKALILYSLMYFLAIYMLRTEGDLRLLCGGMMVVSAILSVYALFSFLVPQSFFPPGALAITDGATRLHYSSYTYYFSQLVPLFWLSLALVVKDGVTRIMIAIASGIEVALVALSGLRAAWIALLISGLVFLVWRRKGLLPVAFALGIATSILLLIGPQDVINRIGVTGTAADLGFTGRLDELQTVWFPLIQQHPLGLGTGAFSSSASLHWQSVFGELDFAFTRNGVTHNGYLEVLGELGVVGFAIYLALLAAIVNQVLKNFRILKGTLTRGINTLALGVVLSYCVIGLFTPAPILFPVNVYFWLFAGVAAALPRIDQASIEPHPDQRAAPLPIFQKRLGR